MPRTLIAFLALVAPLRATEVVVSTPIALAPYVSPSQPETIFVDGFDPALGTLTKVHVAMTMHESGIVRGENLAQGPALFTWETQSGIQLASTADELLFQVDFPKRIGMKRCTPFDGAVDYGGGSGFTFPFKYEADIATAYVATTPAELARFIGPGPVAFNARRLGHNEAAANSGKGTHGVYHAVGARVVCIYTYL